MLAPKHLHGNQEEMNDFFTVREERGLRLITPAHSAAVGNAAWNPHNLWLRSRIETLDGYTVSQGFGKFFNLGHGPLDLNIGIGDVAKAVDRGDALATLKMDGSLLIRSVHKNDVICRTRGSFSYEHLDNSQEMGEFFERHPKLIEPGFASQYSLLFEWTSPTNVIVLRYPEPKLTLIGAVDHRNMSYVPVSDLKEIASSLNVDLVDFFPLTAQGWTDLYASMESDKEIEGYVIRLNREQTLVKVKCSHYLTKHALKSRLTTETLADMYFQYGRPNFEGFMSRFAEDFDEEIGMWAMPAIAGMYDGVRELLKIEQHLVRKAEAAQLILEAKVNTRPENAAFFEREMRKDFALQSRSDYGSTKKFSLAMALYLNESHKYTNLLKSILLQNTRQVEMSFMKPGRDDLEDDA